MPGAPRSLDAEADGTSRIELSWRAPTSDGGARITGYRIEVSEDGGGSWEDLVANSRNTRTTHVHTGLEPATRRHYRVSAINRIGMSRASRVVSAITDATVPDAPTGLQATAVTSTQIDLFWLAPAYDGGAPVTGYRIEVSEDRRRLDRSGDQHRVQGHRVLAHRAGAGEQAPLPRLGHQPGGHRRAVGERIGRDRRPHRARGPTQHPCPAARGVGDDLEHRLGHRPPRRCGGQRDGHAAARGDERALVDGGEPVRAGRGRPRSRAGRPGRPRRPLRRHLLHDAVRGQRRAATVRHGHAVGELGRGRVPPPRRTRPVHPRLEGQHGERPRRHRRARGARHPGGCRGLVQLGQLRLHRQDRRQSR